jgi:hypothetical protein
MEGNLINRIMERSKQPVPVVGMGVTLCLYSDRHPATVVRVSPTGKTAWVQEDNAKRTDSHGMSESQEYTFTPDPTAPVQRVNLTSKGWKVQNGPRVLFGRREKYHDFSF